MNVVVVDSGGANIGSVCYALDRLGVSARPSADADTIAAADRVILPGVGAAPAAMARLRALGLVEVLRGLHQPLLGICLGMQLLYEASEEGGVDCLGILPGRVVRLSEDAEARVPHMGWNRLQDVRDEGLLAGVDAGAQVYFVHGYAAPVGPGCLASCQHGMRFAAAVQSGSVAGTQFHPERSGPVGARILENFLRAPT